MIDDREVVTVELDRGSMTCLGQRAPVTARTAAGEAPRPSAVRLVREAPSWPRSRPLRHAVDAPKKDNALRIYEHRVASRVDGVIVVDAAEMSDGSGAPHNFLSCASLPLNLSRSQRPIPLTVCGVGPRAPSVYCHIVQVFQFLGTTGVGPYCASQNQHSARTGSVLVPSSCLM
jgi:hypothetical protein